MSALRDLLMREGFSARVRLANGVECIVRREFNPRDQFVATFIEEGIEEAICHVDSPHLDEAFWVGADVRDIRNPLQERVPLRIDYIPPQHPPSVLALIDAAADEDPGEACEADYLT